MFPLWILFALLAWILRYHWSRRHLYIVSRKLNGPLSLPIIGSTLPFVLCKNEDILEKIFEIVQRYKNPVRFWLGPLLLVVCKEPQLVEKIMRSSRFSCKHEIYDLMKSFLGEGLITASGDNYKAHKRIIQPHLNLNFSEQSIQIFERQIQICCNNLEQKVDYFDIGHEIHLCTADIIGETILGVQFNSQKGENLRYIEAFSDIYKIVFARIAKPWLHPDFLFNVSTLGRQHRRVDSVSNQLKEIVFQESLKRRNNAEPCAVTPIVDLISEKPISDLWSHLLTLFNASQDTIAIISSAACLCLGMYPEYQTKVVKEIHEVLGNKPLHLRASDIAKLPYLDMCVKEVLRLFPIGPYIFRKLSEDQQIGDFFLPKDCGVCIPIHNLHRDPKYWENPHHFHPDHFLPLAERARPLYSYMPFSAGPRGCIGKVFANISVKVILINLLQRFEIEAQGKLPDVKFTMDISVRSLHGYKVRIKRRNY